MNNLPKPILDNIYKYKHQLEFRHCMDELTDNNTDTMHLTRQALLRYLNLNQNKKNMEYKIKLKIKKCKIKIRFIKI